MKGLLSLDQELRELRAARRGKAQKGATSSHRSSELKETERPWQADIDQVHQTMRELLRAVAGLSGVELPGLPSGLQDDEAPPPRLDIKNLKDRFRNDLEGFSIRTTEELAKQAREQTRAALEAVQNEVGGMVDQVAAEFRENLQLPAQIEKLLEPCVEDAEARLEKSISQKFEHLVTQHEHLVQDKLQETISSVHAQMGALEQTVQQIRDLQSESAAQRSAEQPNAAADVELLLAEHDRLAQGRLQEALSPVHDQMSALEQTVRQIRDLQSESAAQRSAEQPNAAADVEHLLAEHDRLAQGMLQEALSPVHDQMSALEQTVQQIRNLQSELAAQRSAEQPNAAADVEHLLAEHDRLAQGRLQEALSPVHDQMSALEQTVQQIRDLKADADAQPPAEQARVAEIADRMDQLAAEFREKLQDRVQIEKVLEPRFGEAEARLEKSICQRVEHLVSQHEQLVQEKLEGTLSSVQAQITALEQTVQKIRDLRTESVAKLPVERPLVVADSALKKDESSQNLGLKGFLDQAFSRIEWSMKNFTETVGVHPGQAILAGSEEQSNPIPFHDMERERRIQQALDHLGQLGSKDPYPAS